MGCTTLLVLISLNSITPSAKCGVTMMRLALPSDLKMAFAIWRTRVPFWNIQAGLTSISNAQVQSRVKTLDIKCLWLISQKRVGRALVILAFWYGAVSAVFHAVKYMHIFLMGNTKRKFGTECAFLIYQKEHWRHANILQLRFKNVNVTTALDGPVQILKVYIY